MGTNTKDRSVISRLKCKDTRRPYTQQGPTGQDERITENVFDSSECFCLKSKISLRF